MKYSIHKYVFISVYVPVTRSRQCMQLHYLSQSNDTPGQLSRWYKWIFVDLTKIACLVYSAVTSLVNHKLSSFTSRFRPKHWESLFSKKEEEEKKENKINKQKITQMYINEMNISGGIKTGTNDLT